MKNRSRPHIALPRRPGLVQLERLPNFRERDFRVVFVADATSSTYERGLQELRNIGVAVMTTADCLDALAHGRSGADDDGQA